MITPLCCLGISEKNLFNDTNIAYSHLLVMEHGILNTFPVSYHQCLSNNIRIAYLPIIWL